MSKELILKGEVDAFHLLLSTHFLNDSAAAEQPVDATVRLLMANHILNNVFVVDWTILNVEKIYHDVDVVLAKNAQLFKAEIRFHIETINAFSKVLMLDQKLHPALNELKTILLAHAVADKDFWWKDRPLKTLISFIMSQMVGWTDQLGGTANALLELFQTSVEKLKALGLAEGQSLVIFSQQIQKDYHKALDKYERLAVRLKDSELGVVKALYFYDVIASFLNGILQGKKMPQDVMQFLQGKWLHEMQIMLIQQGIDSVIWQRWRKLLTTMVKYYQDDIHVDQDPYHKSILISFPDELENLIRDSEFHLKDFESFCSEVAFDFSRKASGINLSGLVDALEIALKDGSVGVEKKVSTALIQNAKAYDAGQWFLYKNDNDQIQRIRLLIKLPEFDYILFVNLIGQKSLQTHYDQFAYLLSSKRLIPLRLHDQLNFAVNFVLDKLLKQFDELYQARQSKKKRLAIEAKRAQEELERSNAARKAIIEAEQLAKEQASEKEAQFMAQISDDLKRQARLSINSLALGAWIDLLDPATKIFKRAKLAVKYAASGRYVFVDLDGTVVSDCHRDELVDMLLHRQLKLLESDGQFADRLASIIKGIRQT